MKLLFRLAVTLLLTPNALAEQAPLVPLPATYATASEASWDAPKDLSVRVPDIPLWNDHVEVFSRCAYRITGGSRQVSLSTTDKADIRIERDASLTAEGYSLSVASDGVVLKAASIKGLAHGTATLLQLLGANPVGALPGLKIDDDAKLGYRNFMVDMGRNPHSFQLLKEAIDLLWFYKIDSIQLHLTDDQRFAFPSTAFPKLWDGLISLEQFKALERYAAVRGVTIIPELEVPGHSGILRDRYPGVFGKNAGDLASSDKAFGGITTILDEMIEVFSSSPYIHIGGDEAFGVNEELQRELINRLHAYLKSKGKQTIVWEGPRAGKGSNKVHTDVIHLNWRTINYPADRMLKDGYRVVNAAWDPLYIVDHYPRINFTMTSPEHIYTTLRLTRFAHVNPGMPTFKKPIEVEPSERLIGFCMPWWEGRERNFFEQNVPRLIPFAEVAWNPQIERDFAAFNKRVVNVEAMRKMAFYPVRISATNLAVAEDGVFHDETKVECSTQTWVQRGESIGTIRYTLDGTEPTRASTQYTGPIDLSKTTTVRAALFVDDDQVGHGSRRNLIAVTPIANLALGKPVTSSATSGPPFSVGRITDGGVGNLDFYLGYPAEPEPIVLSVDLEKVSQVSRIVVHSYSVNNSFEKYVVEVSPDGRRYEQVGERLTKPDVSSKRSQFEFAPRDVRFVRIRSWGNKGYVFDSFSKIVEVMVFQ